MGFSCLLGIFCIRWLEPWLWCVSAFPESLTEAETSSTHPGPFHCQTNMCQTSGRSLVHVPRHSPEKQSCSRRAAKHGSLSPRRSAPKRSAQAPRRGGASWATRSKAEGNQTFELDAGPLFKIRCVSIFSFELFNVCPRPCLNAVQGSFYQESLERKSPKRLTTSRSLVSLKVTLS